MGYFPSPKYWIYTKNVMLPSHQRRKGTKKKKAPIRGYLCSKTTTTRFYLSNTFLAPCTDSSTENCLTSWGPFKFAPHEGAQSLPPLPFFLLAPFLCQLSSLIEASGGGGGRAVVNKCRAVNQELDRSRRGPA